MRPAANLILRNTEGNSFDVPVRADWNGNSLVTVIKHTHNQILRPEREASRDWWHLDGVSSHNTNDTHKLSCTQVIRDARSGEPICCRSG